MGKRADGEGSIHKFSRKRKDGSFWEGWQGSISLGYKPNGKRDRRAVYGHTQSEVRGKLDALKKSAQEGTFTDSKLTVAAYLERWLEHKDRTVKPRSAEFYRYNTNKYIVPRIGKKKLEKLTPLDVQGMMSDIADSVGVSTANKCRTTLCAALAQAVRWQVVIRNVVVAVGEAERKAP